MYVLQGRQIWFIQSVEIQLMNKKLAALCKHMNIGYNLALFMTRITITLKLIFAIFSCEIIECKTFFRSTIHFECKEAMIYHKYTTLIVALTFYYLFVFCFTV